MEFHERVVELQRQYEKSGITKDIVDESWRQVRDCFDEVQRGSVEFAALLFDTARTSFGMHVQTEEWFPAVASALAFCTAVSVIEADFSRRELPFPEDLRPGVQNMLDMSVSLAHVAGVPIAGCMIAEALTAMQLGDRTHARELSAILSGESANQRLRGLRAAQRRQINDARRGSRNSADSVAALRTLVDSMLLGDLKNAIANGAGDHVLAGPTVTPALLAASTTGRSVLFIAPGMDHGTAIRLEPPTADRAGHPLSESIFLPHLGLDAVKEQSRRIREALGPGELRKRVRDRAVMDAMQALAEAFWEPVLSAWPELRGSRVALIPLGDSALLPFFTTPVDGVPAGALMDLTIVPSGKSLLFATAVPRPSARKVLVAADPWYGDGAGNAPIPFVTDEARAVAAVHDAAPLFMRPGAEIGSREDTRSGGSAEGESTGDDQLRALVNAPAHQPPDDQSVTKLVGSIADANLIHLAGHGILDPQHPLRSSLLLGRPIQLGTLMGEDLTRGTTIVLSACHLAGIGTVLSGEQLGFPAAMLAMGASSVIAALWPVPDSSHTVRMMTDLHEDLRDPGSSPSIALGRAVARAAADPSVRPTVWASFAHFGA
ncbi:CHAT domain-containing protein [Streptomyces sp. Lzd4kr]|nr:CHAT domain-containing protein [Streptomyces sp. Lzd4kr]